MPNYNRLLDVLKGSWIYKLQNEDDRKLPPQFKRRDIKDAHYTETHNVPVLLLALKDGQVLEFHPAELRMREMEELSGWLENRAVK